MGTGADPNFVLRKEIRQAIEKDYQIYWQLEYPFIALRAVTFTYETGKVRSKQIALFHLASELGEVVLTQTALGYSFDARDYKEALTDAYWDKYIPWHPGRTDFNDLVFARKVEHGN